MMSDNFIYKIEDAAVWADAQESGAYTGSALDLADGFIHLSAAHQVRETAAKWFGGRVGLVLVGVDAQALGGALKWEASRGGALFPHLYNPLPMSAVRNVVPMPINEAGVHVFGADIP
jgi:uncharacterized protein (DUF952 family)